MAAHSEARRKGVLEQIARRAMEEYGFLSDFPSDALSQLEAVQPAGRVAESPGIDLRHLLWASIDNDESLDLDQLTVAEALADTQVKVLVAIADVASLVKKIGYRCTRPPQHDLGLHRRRDLSHAAGEALHGSHLPQPS